MIPDDFNHPFSHFSHFDSIICRLERVLLNKFDYKNQFNIIFNIGMKNYFNINRIKTIYKQISFLKIFTHDCIKC